MQAMILKAMPSICYQAAIAPATAENGDGYLRVSATEQVYLYASTDNYYDSHDSMIAFNCSNRSSLEKRVGQESVIQARIRLSSLHNGLSSWWNRGGKPPALRLARQFKDSRPLSLSILLYKGKLNHKTFRNHFRSQANSFCYQRILYIILDYKGRKTCIKWLKCMGILVFKRIGRVVKEFDDYYEA